MLLRLSPSPARLIPIVLAAVVLTGSLSKAARSQNSADSLDNASPSAVVEQLHVTLLNIMKNAKKLGMKGRYQTVAPKVQQVYDLPRWIRLATGRHWKRANAAQKEQLMSEFKKMSAATYASQFDNYSGESFKTIGEKAGPRKTVLVKTKIIRETKKPVGLTYVLIKVSNQWRIVDILLDDKISQLAVRRSEYRNLLKQSGIDGLINKLKEKVDSLLKG